MIIKHMFLILGGLAGAAAAIPTHAANAANMQKMDAGSASILARPDFQHREMKIPASFLGISVEYGNIPTFFSPVQLPLTVRLLKRLGRLQGPPVLRIGGNSEDRAVWNLRSVRPLPPGDHINLSSATAAMLRAAAEATGGKLILGINFGRGTPAMAAPWIRCALADIGVGHIMAFEIGKSVADTLFATRISRINLGKPHRDSKTPACRNRRADQRGINISGRIGQQIGDAWIFR